MPTSFKLFVDSINLIRPERSFGRVDRKNKRRAYFSGAPSVPRLRVTHFDSRPYFENDFELSRSTAITGRARYYADVHLDVPISGARARRNFRSKRSSVTVLSRSHCRRAG